ncbi:aminodeoxychorismate/anthranilate synthase component II [Pullulanibacillus camelliae]|uniref:Aminodeoxychorismate/anthranilate synthase component II n=1 Tax=Pullulanibacillus camelliae TaxID=1707096 RepID=A0A8J2VUM5_9BACL|nr:aminodeoxychorismate/anthranilate synthase component II [Pullulanibacillus camelliae]GGE40462.1 aminodeoxychorismate/anthranilate synthase component II [Pullulanibacillus camelliae]
MILMIDNYDSFTYNLVQYVKELGYTVTVYKNDQITLEAIERLNLSAILLSPGPGRPETAGVTLDVIRAYKEKVAILGICLGHQAIVQAFGGNIIKARHPRHGKRERVYHDGQTIYHGLPQSLQVARYHSLIADERTLPQELQVTGYSTQQEMMSVRHKNYPIEGVQYHPESILTTHGRAILSNFFKHYATNSRIKEMIF